MAMLNNQRVYIYIIIYIIHTYDMYTIIMIIIDDNNEKIANILIVKYVYMTVLPNTCNIV